MWKKQPTQSTSDLSTKDQTSEIYLSHIKISEVATLVSMIPNFWRSLEVSATELHLCFVIKGNMRWKRTFLPMVTIVVLHHKHMKLFKPFTPHVIVWSVRKCFNQSICRTKEQKPRLQCLASAIPKPVMPSGHQRYEKRKASKKKKRMDLAVLAKTPRLNRFF